MKKLFSTEEKVEKLVCVVSGVLCAALLESLLAGLWYLFSGWFYRTVPRGVFFIAMGTFMMIAAIAMLVNYLVLPALFPGYFGHCADSGDDDSNLPEDTVVIAVKRARRVFTNFRLKITIVLVVLSFIGMAVVDVCFPIGTIADELPTTVFYSSDEERILDGDFGTVAKIMEDDAAGDYLWVCSHVDVYGPFKYGGELEEIEATQTRTESAIFVDSGKQYGSYPGDSYQTYEKFYIKFSHYDDGDWMIVKRFVLGQNFIPPSVLDKTSAFVTVMNLLESDEVVYEKHDLSGLSAEDCDSVLTAATNGVIEMGHYEVDNNAL